MISKRGVEAIYVLITCLALCLQSRAQTLTVLHDFSVLTNQNHGPVLTNSDGALCYSSLALSKNVLYGGTQNGGPVGSGVVFRVNTDGSGYSVLHSFPVTGLKPLDGSGLTGGLIVSNDTLYGTAQLGGANNSGTIFSMSTTGSLFTVLHTFAPQNNNSNLDGIGPASNLTLSHGVLYGATESGGIYSNGVIFSINVDGSNFTNLYTFDGPHGAKPYGPLVVADGNIYGATSLGGAVSAGGNTTGLIFTMSTNGSNFSILYNFGIVGVANTNGYFPSAGVILVGDTLFGTAPYGGPYACGNVFAINTNGTGFRVVHNFDATNGAEPYGPLTYINGRLFGTTFGKYVGSQISYGSVFSLSLDGSGFTNYTNFPVVFNSGIGTNMTGSRPFAGVVSDGAGSLYGANYYGGSGSNGTIYALSPISSVNCGLSIMPAANGYLVVTWCDTSSSLQSSPNVTGPYTTLDGVTSPYYFLPTDAAQFFRLISN